LREIDVPPEYHKQKEKPVIVDWFVVEHTGFDTCDLVNSECSALPKHLYLIPEYKMVGTEMCNLEFADQCYIN